MNIPLITISPGDSLLCEGLKLVAETPDVAIGTDGRSYSTETQMLDWLARYLSTLLYVPDNPHEDPLHIYRLYWATYTAVAMVQDVGYTERIVAHTPFYLVFIESTTQYDLLHW